MGTMRYEVRWANRAASYCPSFEAAVSRVTSTCPVPADAVLCRDILLAGESGRAALVWDDEETAGNDDAARACAAIYQLGDIR